MNRYSVAVLLIGAVVYTILRADGARLALLAANLDARESDLRVASEERAGRTRTVEPSRRTTSDTRWAG